jgi:ubiquitin carboxyl-terminal hydrolase L3
MRNMMAYADVSTQTEPDSPLAKLLATCASLNPDDRALVLEESKDIEDAYANAARQGQTNVPASAESEVDFHYVCFVQSHKNHRLYEMDGDKKGPVDSGYSLLDKDDLLGENGLKLVREFIEREKNLNFSLLALVNGK